VFNRLRNEVLAGLGPGAQVLVVSGASPGPASALVAANLAVALARTGSEVALVGAHLPENLVDDAPLARIFGVAPTPGLSEVLAGRVSLADAAQRAPRHPYLRVITTGGAATAAGLMQSQALRETLDALRAQAQYVVVEAPSTATSADAQSLASLADGAILTVELRRARRPQLVDAADQLHRVATPLLGAVVLPKLSAKRTTGPAAPPPVRPAIPLNLPVPPAARTGTDPDRPEPGRQPTPIGGAGRADETAVLRRVDTAVDDVEEAAPAGNGRVDQAWIDSLVDGGTGR